MKLKTFRAQTMADALAAVKKDLGKDAVILHTRTLRTGGFMGLWKKPAVEITASDEPTVSPSSRRLPQPASAGTMSGQSGQDADLAALLGHSALSAYRRAGAQIPESAPASRPAAPQPSPTLARSAGQPSAPIAPPIPASAPAVEPSTTMSVRQRRGVEGSMATPAAVSVPSSLPTPTSELVRELSEIKLLVNQVLQSTPVGPGGSGLSSASGSGQTGMPEALFQQYLKLLQSSVSRDLTDRIVGAVRDELTPSEMADDSIVRATVLRHLAGLLPSAETLPRTPQGHSTRRPVVIALIGPTGVGKTTTIAKLAAAYKLRHAKTVGLITSDTYRIAAVDQLRTYAGIIGLDLKVVLSPSEMASAVASFSDRDYILIDTAGRSQNATDRLGELAEFLAAADPDETHLVLSSAASEAVLFKTAEAFAAARPNRVILTKLDEAVNFGVLVNVLNRLSGRLNLRLSFVTTGQEVPDHIEPGRSERLARMVLDNALPEALQPVGAGASA